MSGCGDNCGCSSSTEGTQTLGAGPLYRRHLSTDDVMGGDAAQDVDSVEYLQSLTNNEHTQRRQVVENLGYKTALEELAGERYGAAYFAAQEKGWAEGHNDAVRVMSALLKK